MRNYPLLKNKNNAETPYNWQKTYVNSLVMHTKSLIDYSNYFLADYRLGSSFILLGTYGDFNCYSIEKLKYHQYRNTEEEAYYFLKASDWIDHSADPITQGAKKIRAGRHIINNNQKESDLDTYKDWENIVIQPIGYTAFYIMTYNKGRFNFKYTRNAQLYYGTEQSITPAPFDTRFFYRLNDFNITQQDLPGLNIPAKPYRDADYIDDQPDYSAPWGISDYQGIIWTDQDKPPMGFLYQKKINNNLLGEEVIADIKVKATIEVARNSSVVYTITAQGKKAGDVNKYLYYSSNSVLRLI